MSEYLNQVKSSWNKTADSEWYMSLRSDEKIKEIIENPQTVFHSTTYSVIQKFIPDLRGKRVLLPSSGNNHAAFAFSILGAEVTSLDISERQLDNAELISKRYGWNINYICDDTMTLNQIKDNEYDIVYTSNGTHVWINDLNLMYKNFYRVLKPSGISIMYDIHPFNRPFIGDIGEPKIRKSYSDVIPYYHWRIQDLMNAMISAGFAIKQVEEMQTEDATFWYKYDELITKTEGELKTVSDWRYNPMAALPAWLTICIQKVL